MTNTQAPYLRSISTICNTLGFVEPHLLAIGSQGLVYRAHSPSDKRCYALKLHAQSHTANPYLALRREASLQRYVARANGSVPDVIDFNSVDDDNSVNEDPIAYILMSYIGAESLHKKQLPVAEALRVALSLARTLEICHKTDIVHYDIKPRNISIGEDGKAYLLDFGAARRRPFQAEDDFIGTLGYAAPEVIDGTFLQYNFDAPDIFSFGATLYAFLAGEGPFLLRREDQSLPLMDRFRAYYNRVMARAYIPLQERFAVSADLSALVDNMLCSDPKQRPGSFRTISQQIQENLENSSF